MNGNVDKKNKEVFMKISKATSLIRLFQRAMDNSEFTYELIELEILNDQLDGFHDWADHKSNLGTYEIKILDDSYYFLFIDWRNSEDNYYIVVYPKNRKGPLAEIHKTKDIMDQTHLEWSYKPMKQDGRNQERKELFVRKMSSLTLNFSIPTTVLELSKFIEDILLAVTCRISADNLQDLDVNISDSFPEGREIERLHIEKERSPKLISLAKERYLNKNGVLECEICGFNFEKVYGAIGKGFIEGHHTKPLSDYKSVNKTKVEDIILVCSNCHRMIHRKRPWLDAEDLKNII
jgi:hypothetical protein